MTGRRVLPDPVDECIERVHKDLVAAVAWDLGDRDDKTDDAAEELMDRLRAHLHGLPVEVLTEALIVSRWDPAYEAAITANAQTNREIEKLGGPS